MNNKKTKLIVLTGLFAAIIFITTAYILHIPTGPNGEYIHLGDSFIYLAACLLPTPYAMVAGAVGGALSDALSPGGAVYVIPTLIIKPLLTIFFTSKSKKLICTRNVIAVFLAGVTGLVGYCIATTIITGNFWVALLDVPLGSLQPLGCGIAFIIFAFALDKMNIKKRL
ncbi:TIGR04002 family protein [Inconstantimicrobium mannanitabidum]|uniref:Membrane protein n=1 Tax=Inconstantimicrobium mannanitabidum TaxID=1604901 RepID=A0ACB5RCE8_9CLOT|nr:TIGR04002 family protein [Clostridium sp. TW13]GKX66755.1 membrane protein [Clostridium sp. TW13]